VGPPGRAARASASGIVECGQESPICPALSSYCGSSVGETAWGGMTATPAPRGRHSVTIDRRLPPLDNALPSVLAGISGEPDRERLSPLSACTIANSGRLRARLHPHACGQRHPGHAGRCLSSPSRCSFRGRSGHEHAGRERPTGPEGRNCGSRWAWTSRCRSVSSVSSSTPWSATSACPSGISSPSRPS